MKRRTASTQQLELFAADGCRLPTALSRATARRGRQRWEIPAPKPWHATILAVDTAKRSGWAIYCMGKLQESGEVASEDEATLAQLVRNTLEYGTGCGLPVALVLESPYGGNVNVVAALGAARECWLRAWRHCDQARGRVVLVQPNQWRGPVLGARAVSMPRAEVRELEQRIARGMVGKLYDGTAPPVGTDEAAAILIGRWAAQARAVGRVIGKRATRASLEAWTKGGWP